jgi:hypothetical protein
MFTVWAAANNTPNLEHDEKAGFSKVSPLAYFELGLTQIKEPKPVDP